VLVASGYGPSASRKSSFHASGHAGAHNRPHGRARNAPGVVRKGLIRVVCQFDVPDGPRIPSGLEEFGHQRFQASAVRDRAIEVPVDPFGGEPDDLVNDALDGRAGFVDLPVRSVDAGDVPVAAISTDDDQAAGQGTFNGDQHVVAVNAERLPGDGVRVHEPGGAAVERLIGAGGASDGHSLPGGQVMAVPHELCGRVVRVAAGEQPAQLCDGLGKSCSNRTIKEPVVVRMCSAMSTFVGHAHSDSDDAAC